MKYNQRQRKKNVAKSAQKIKKIEKESVESE